VAVGPPRTDRRGLRASQGSPAMTVNRVGRVSPAPTLSRPRLRRRSLTIAKRARRRRTERRDHRDHLASRDDLEAMDNRARQLAEDHPDRPAHPEAAGNQETPVNPADQASPVSSRKDPLSSDHRARPVHQDSPVDPANPDDPGAMETPAAKDSQATAALPANPVHPVLLEVQDSPEDTVRSDPVTIALRHAPPPAIERRRKTKEKEKHHHHHHEAQLFQDVDRRKRAHLNFDRLFRHALCLSFCLFTTLCSSEKNDDE